MKANHWLDIVVVSQIKEEEKLELVHIIVSKQTSSSLQPEQLIIIITQ